MVPVMFARRASSWGEERVDRGRPRMLKWAACARSEAERRKSGTTPSNTGFMEAGVVVGERGGQLWEEGCLGAAQQLGVGRGWCGSGRALTVDGETAAGGGTGHGRRCGGV